MTGQEVDPDQTDTNHSYDEELPPHRNLLQEVINLDDSKGLPPEIVEFRQELIMFEATSGSMPPPSMLGRYNDVIPNGAERIVAMAEAQQNHRMTLERTVVDSDIAVRNRALWLGFVIVLSAVIGGVILAIAGMEIIGSAMIATGLISSGLAFFKGIAAKEERMSRQRSEQS